MHIYWNGKEPSELTDFSTKWVLITESICNLKCFESEVAWSCSWDFVTNKSNMICYIFTFFKIYFSMFRKFKGVRFTLTSTSFSYPWLLPLHISVIISHGRLRFPKIPHMRYASSRYPLPYFKQFIFLTRIWVTMLLLTSVSNLESLCEVNRQMVGFM